MKLIALEEHFLTDAVHAALARFPAPLRDPTIDFPDEAMAARLRDLADARLRDMDAAGVDVQVLSLIAPGVQSLTAAEAVPLARAANDLAAAAVRSHPDRFQFLAVLPTPDPAEAERELERAVVELGAQGAVLFERTGEKRLDHPDFAALLATAAKLRAPLYLHPQTPPMSVRQAYYGDLDEQVAVMMAASAVGWHYDAGIALLRLIVTGTFDRHPELQVIVGHWGEMVLFYLDRIALMNQAASIDLPIEDYFRRNIWITPSGIFSQRYFRWALEVVGAERIMFSADYPYVPWENGKVRGFLEAADLSLADRERIAHGNWDRLCAGIRRTGPTATGAIQSEAGS